jgi:LAO/AO transport system kinase
MPILLAVPDLSNPTSLARALSLVENGGPAAEQLLGSLRPRLGRAHRVGVTGPPGAGKSTLVERLVRHWRKAGRTVAVVAVDPSSPRTGGALLGDRIRMEPVALDDGVFIRSMATRGALGGLARSTLEVCDVLDAAGFDLVVVETVGVGQTELDVVGVTDTTVVVLVPESGDAIQTLKSGLLEVADLFVINKADRPGGEQLRKELEQSLDLRAEPGSDGWRPPAMLASALTGSGVEAVADAIGRHTEWLSGNGRLDQRRAGRRPRD